MAFEPKEWADGDAGGTPITAAELNRIEQGIADAQTVEAGDIQGTFKASQIPTLAQSKVTGLSTALSGKADASALADLVARVEALETPAG